MKSFLSHASLDNLEARALGQGLRTLGEEVWVDVLEGLRPGHAGWMEQIEAALLGCRRYLVLVGDRGVDRWVRAELDFALHRHATDPDMAVVPLLLPGVRPEQLPHDVLRFQALSLAAVDPEGGPPSTWGPDSFARLAAALRDHRVLPSLDADRCPFAQLGALNEDQALQLWGREGEIRQVLAAFDAPGRRWVAVTGRPGAGKSSLVRAGVVPACWRGLFPQGRGDPILVCTSRPGSQPRRNLAADLHAALGKGTDAPLHRWEAALEGPDPHGLRRLLRSEVPSGRLLLLVLDPLDGLYFCDPAEVAALDLALAAALADEDGPLRLLTVHRSDIDAPALLPGLWGCFNRMGSRIFVRPPGPDGLRRAVEGPAALAGLRLDEGLADRILGDMANSADPLAALGLVLPTLWAHREGDRLTQAAYQALGEPTRWLADAADRALAVLDAEEQDAAAALCLGLVAPRRAGFLPRVRPVEQLIALAGGGAAARRALLRLSGDLGSRDGRPTMRLLSVRDEGGVPQATLSSEVLLRAWPWLEHHVLAQRGRLVTRGELEAAARTWEQSEFDAACLPRGALLRHLEEGLPADALAVRFLEAGRQEELRRQEEEEATARTSARRRRALNLVLAAAVMALLAGGAGSVRATLLLGARQRQADAALAAVAQVEAALLLAAQQLDERPGAGGGSGDAAATLRAAAAELAREPGEER